MCCPQEAQREARWESGEQLKERLQPVMIEICEVRQHGQSCRDVLSNRL